MTVTLAGETCHRFVDRVVDDFVNEVVKSANRGITDVHRRPFADVFHIGQPFQVCRNCNLELFVLLITVYRFPIRNRISRILFLGSWCWNSANSRFFVKFKSLVQN